MSWNISVSFYKNYLPKGAGNEYLTGVKHEAKRTSSKGRVTATSLTSEDRSRRVKRDKIINQKPYNKCLRTRIYTKVTKCIREKIPLYFCGLNHIQKIPLYFCTLNHIHQDTKSDRLIAVCKRSLINLICSVCTGKLVFTFDIFTQTSLLLRLVRTKTSGKYFPVQTLLIRYGTGLISIYYFHRRSVAYL